MDKITNTRCVVTGLGMISAMPDGSYLPYP